MENVRIQLEPAARRPDLLIIAGEHSGDEHAARLVRDARLMNPDLDIVAIGGEALQEAGVPVLFDLVEHSVIGFVEVLKNYGFFKALFQELLAWIRENQPRHLLFVDYPGFNLRLADALFQAGLSRKGGGEIGLWYYIAPQIWAWKAKRRFRMAEQLDGLGCILPFEEAFFSDTTLPVRFVGHPFVAEDYDLPLTYESGAPALLLPGSRTQQVQQVFPLQLEGFGRLAAESPEVRARVIYPSSKIRQELESLLSLYPDLVEKVQLLQKSEQVSGSAVLMSSGTMSLACALAGLPGAIVQKVQPFTYWLAKRFVCIEYIGLANIILKRPLIPEYVQKVNTEVLGKELRDSLQDEDRIRLAAEGAEELKAALSVSGGHPSGQWLVDCVNS